MNVATLQRRADVLLEPPDDPCEGCPCADECEERGISCCKDIDDDIEDGTNSNFDPYYDEAHLL